MEFPELAWRKSSYSGSETNCVEIAATVPGPVVGIRDSKNAEGDRLTVGHTAFRRFVRATATATMRYPAS